MVRRARPMEEHGLDEVDAFSAAKDKQMLDDAQHAAAPESEEEEEEEVLALSDEASQPSEDDEYLGNHQDEEVESDENWGASRNDYYGGDNVDDDQVAKQMEQEALRQQKRHLEELNVEDYLDEDVEDWKSSSNQQVDEVKESLDPQSRLEVLKSSHPEFISFLKEISKLKPLLDSFKDGTRLADKVKFTALSTYLGSISAYLALFISKLAEDQKFSFKNHPIMMGILNAREIWRQASELPDVYLEQNAPAEEEEEVEEVQEDSELGDGEENASEVPADEIDLKTRRTIKRLPSKRDDEIDDIDAEEKSQRRKTLRFYTSKIDQQENKKNVKYSGDSDLPYRERLFERKQRLMEEARKRGEKGPGEDLDDSAMNSEDESQMRQINGEDYYNQVAGDRQAAKDSRKQAHQLAVDAAKQGRLAELQETMGENGKRAVNYQILKNRGLTPNRKKGDRNARVKKRKKYETAKKKLSSVRAVHKADHGPYQGEKTGIRKGLSRSIKF